MASIQGTNPNTCNRIDDHIQYHGYESFKDEKFHNKIEHKIRKLDLDDRKDLLACLKQMADLTGLLVLKNTNESTKEEWEYYFGTGFISKIRTLHNKRCPCPSNEHDGNGGVYAVVTISTAYHIFNSNEDKNIKSYDRCQEIWKDSYLEFKLHYNSGEDSMEEPVIMKQLDGFPTLYGHQLVESDLDLEFECDWCAIECVTHDLNLIDSLEKTLQDFQTQTAKLYTKSKSALYKDVNVVAIIGHPHKWPKKICFGQSNTFEDVKDKTILKELRSQQIWCRYSYDNVTCVGSSGSPVFIWGQPITGFGYWFRHPHNHASETKIDSDVDTYFGYSTIGVEHQQ